MTNRTDKGDTKAIVPRMPAKRLYDDVCILGFTDHRDLAWTHKGTAEIWGINELYRYDKVEDFHRWFELHKRDIIDPDKKHIEELGKLPIAVYMQEHFDDIPNSVPFPKAGVEKATGVNVRGKFENNLYFTNSISWMLGEAIRLGFKRIFIYGVDMAQETEYAEQRPNCEYLIGLARGMGIDVYVPPRSDLLKSIGQYGYGVEGDMFLGKLEERSAWLNNQCEQFSKALTQLDGEYKAHMEGVNKKYEDKKLELTTNLRHVEGALQDCRYWRRSWAIPQSDGGATGPSPDRSQDPKTGITESPGAEASTAAPDISPAGEKVPVGAEA